MRDAFFRTIIRLAERDERVVFLTGDLGFKLVDDFCHRFPNRFYNMGVAEANMVSVAAGLALCGKIPFVYSIVPFVTARCVEQIRNDLCNMGAHVIVVGVGGGYAYGENGPTHHGIDDIGLMRSLPGMTVVCPCDPEEVGDSMERLVESDGPAYLRLGRTGEKRVPRTGAAFELGIPSRLRAGYDVALVASGPVAAEAVAAADILAPLGIHPAVYSLHTIKPIERAVEYFAESSYRLIVFIEEHGPCGGMTEAVVSRLALRSRDIEIKCIHAPDAFYHESGSAAELRTRAGIGCDAIVARVQAVIGFVRC